MSSQKALSILQMQQQFLNSIDRDFSTPLLLALKNKRVQLVKMLLEHPKTCTKQSSMKYGGPLHVALANEEIRVALHLLKLQKASKDVNLEHELAKQDEEGNTPLHLAFRVFNLDPENCSKICKILMRNGSCVKIKNK